MAKLPETVCILFVLMSGVLLIISSAYNVFPFLIGLGVGIVLTLWVQDRGT